MHPLDDLSSGSFMDPNINPPTESNETPLLATVNPTTTTTMSTVDLLDEPPAKKCKIQSPEKVRLLEDRLGSILSCCICLDLSTLPMFQVKRKEERHFSNAPSLSP